MNLDDSNHNNNNNDNNNGKQTIAIQVISAGGTSLSPNTITGKIFVGKDNIENGKGNKFKPTDLSNNCQILSFGKSGNSGTTAPTVFGSSGIGSNVINPLAANIGGIPTTSSTFGIPTTSSTFGTSSFPAIPGVACPPGYIRSPDGTLCVV
jgi:tRNA U34 5-carboxymethylaminomethyl modifying enzyme MnmG/GidA